jgi:hypothetical protein
VNPVVPGDVIAAMAIHSAAAEKRAGRKLFEGIDWTRVIEQNREASIGNWVRLVHAVLRRKARCDADDKPGLVDDGGPDVRSRPLQEGDRRSVSSGAT